MTDAVTKICSKCGDSKAITEFYERMNEGRRVIEARCKTCRNIDILAAVAAQEGK